jgi:hypothetical protein
VAVRFTKPTVAGNNRCGAFAATDAGQLGARDNNQILINQPLINRS